MGGQRGTVTQGLVFCLGEVGRRESRWQGTEASKEQHDMDIVLIVSVGILQK